MTQTTERLSLNVFEKRLAADELLFELRAGGWRSLRPDLLLEPPQFQMPGSVPIEKPSYLVAYLEHNPWLGNRHLEIAILKQDYKNALHEIDSLGYREIWQEFFRSNKQLYWIVRQDNTDIIKRDGSGKVEGVTHTEVLTVRQNARTGRPERLCMNAIWRKAVVRECREDWAAF